MTSPQQPHELVSGTNTAPVVRTPLLPGEAAPRVLTDSADVVSYADERLRAAAAAVGGGGGGGPPAPADAPHPLYPDDPQQRQQVRELEEQFSRKLGVCTRVVAYQYLFQDKQAALDVLGQRQPPAWCQQSALQPSDGSASSPPSTSAPSPPAPMASWKRGALALMYPMLKKAISAGLRVNEESAASCMQRIRKIFDEVGERLQANGGQYLVGDRFSAADLTFASMAAVVLMPPQYGAYLPPLDTWPEGFPGAELRSTAAGQHAMRMYELHRGLPRRGQAAGQAVAGGRAGSGDAGTNPSPAASSRL
ncbi:hypothetical protein HYH03_006781 [Edaphochlamys debaryana]|uniref:Glutathione S-transferase n=1 Tax=Edaphochlamys debaryana TaxID=47281 RepID=A0A836BZY6_9CHLO|nr:hypothetical protein HYH03_006781 [Edaphochlamys debaryana]|eukprot:KAG2495175.1 hypothetical protein HYH03_006781 [Edaphochlamys debaryana]